MFIHELIYETVIDEAKQLTVTDVRIGLGYTLVELNEKLCGLSYSFIKEINPKNCTVMDEAGELLYKKASYLLEKIFSYNLIDSALALATANAIINQNIDRPDIDIISLIKPTDKVVMVGYFGPIIETIEKKAIKFIICERNPRGNSLPDYAEYFELKDADIIILTATSIINKTIDNILNMISKARIIAIMGPSTPMKCEIFKGKITHLCGSVIINNQKAKAIVSQGGGTKKLKPVTQKRCVIC